MHHFSDGCRIQIRGWTHKIHSIPRPNGWAMGCLLWGFMRKLTALPWHCTALWVAQEWTFGSSKDSWVFLLFIYVYTSRYPQNYNPRVLIIIQHFIFIKLDACMNWFPFQIEEIRQQTKAEKKRLAMAMRQKQLGALGMKVSAYCIRWVHITLGTVGKLH